MFARVSTFQSPVDKLAESEEVLKNEIVPGVQEFDGERGVISLVDRQSGKSLAITLWETEEAMRASEEAAESDPGQGGGCQQRRDH